MITNPTPTQPETLDQRAQDFELAKALVRDWLMEKGIALMGVNGEVSRSSVNRFKLDLQGRIVDALNDARRAAVTAPRGDVATTARNRDVAQRVVMSTESVLGERFDIATRHELADRITAALDAATSSLHSAERESPILAFEK